MPNDGLRIYSETRNGVKYGVDLAADVCKVLGITTANVGYACSNRHGRTNKWNKHKPVRSSRLQPIEGWTNISGEGIWGMLFPSLPGGTLYLREMCVAIAKGESDGTGHGYHNYTYLPPRPGIDCCRILDFDGYAQNAPQPVACGTAGSGGSGEVSINAFDSETVDFYVQDTWGLITVAELYPEPQMAFCVELFYHVDTEPERAMMIAVSSQSLKTLPRGGSAKVSVSVAEIKEALQELMGNDTAGSGSFTVMAYFGMRQLTAKGETARASAATRGDNHFSIPTADASDPVSGYFGMAGYVAPWGSRHSEFQCRINLANYFSYRLYGEGWAINPSDPVFVDMSVAQVTGSADTIAKVSLDNTGTQGVQVTSHGDGGNKPEYQKIWLRAHAIGNYPDGGAYDPARLDGSTGNTVYCSVRTAPTGSFNSLVEIPPGQERTFYLDIPGLFPRGQTYSVIVEASSDGGLTWVIATSLNANIKRT